MAELGYRMKIVLVLVLDIAKILLWESTLCWGLQLNDKLPSSQNTKRRQIFVNKHCY